MPQVGAAFAGALLGVGLALRGDGGSAAWGNGLLVAAGVIAGLGALVFAKTTMPESGPSYSYVIQFELEVPATALAGVDIPVTPVPQQIFRCELPRRWGYEFPMTIDPGGVHWRSYGDNEIVVVKTKHDEAPGIRFGADLDRFHNEFMPDLVRQHPRLNLAFAAGAGTAGI